MGFTFLFLFTTYASKSETQKWKSWEIIQKKKTSNGVQFWGLLY